MVSEPRKWIEPFKNAGANGYTFHYEAVKEGNLPYYILIKMKLKKL
jgi:pentose-5-phosphate-3-epimerase